MTDFATRLRELIAKRETMLPTLQDHLANHAEQIAEVVEAAGRVKGMEHPGGWTDHVPGLAEMKAALDALNRSEP